MFGANVEPSTTYNVYLTFGAADDRRVCYAVTYSGVNQTNPYSVSITNLTTDSNANPNIGVNSTVNELAVAVHASRSTNPTWRYYQGLNNRTHNQSITSGDNSVELGVSDKKGVNSDMNNFTWATGNGFETAMIALSLKGLEATDDCTCTDDQTWLIDDGSTCTLTNTCNLGSNPVRVMNGKLVITPTGKLVATGCSGNPFPIVMQGGSLVCVKP